jgi:tripartite-type tricarboxylate transporter receptor subunit TctC
VLVGKLHDAVDGTIRSPEVAKKFTDLGADPQFGTPAEFAAYIEADLAKWSRLAREANLKIE